MSLSVFFSILGVILVVIVMTDVIWTTITTKGNGPLSRFLIHAFKRTFLFFHRRSGNRKLLVLTGPVALTGLGIFWLIGLWGGWFLILLGDGNIVEAKTGSEAGLAQYVYYTGMTLSTLGIGDFKAGTDYARLLTTLAAFNGLVLITLIITYAIPMVGAITTRRKVAYSFYILGGSSGRLLEKFDDRDTLGELAELLRDSTAELLECAEQRFAYPLLDCFYSMEREFSLGLQLAILDEALWTLGSSDSARNSRLITFQILYFRSGVIRYLSSRTGWSEEELSKPERRKAFQKVVAEDGWSWEEVLPK